TSRDRMTRDHILLETQHIVALTLDSCRRKHLRRFLEGRSRDPALRTQRSLGDTQEPRGRCSRLGIPELSQLLVVTPQDGILLPHLAQTHDLAGLELRRL